MIARSTVHFAALHHLLLDLGFTQSKRGKFWFFEHGPSGTVFIYRPCRARERVTVGDLHMTRHHLDWRGLMAPETFNDLLKQPTDHSPWWQARSKGRPARSTVTFAELRQFLSGLGFTLSKRGKFWCFEHASSETILLYRPYRARERVTLFDLHQTRTDLDWRGVLTEQAFDDLLKKVTA